MRKSLILLVVAIAFLSACNNAKKGDSSHDDGVAFKRELSEQEIENGILTPEVLWKFGRLGEMQVSPDAKNVLYTLTYYSVESNSSNTQIYSIPVEGGEAKQLTTDTKISCFNPRWISNDKIAYLSTEGESVQMWTMNAEGKDNKRVSNLAFDINSFKISPKGDKVLFIADVKMDETPAEVYPDLPNTNCIIATDLMYRHWNDWHDYKYSHIFVADMSENITSAADIMEGEKFDSPLSPYFDDAEITWSNDGKTIAYTCKKLSGKQYAVSTNSDIYLYNVEDGTVKNISEGMMGYDKYPVFSPDSKKMAWISMETPGYESDKERLFVVDLESGEKTYITEKWDYGCSNVVWDNENPDRLFFTTVLNATFQIFSVDLTSCEISQLTKGQHDYTG
ncbi:MAG: PD40 domain-containing protein, partial [Bacteroidales bacterium]|nr:PD40 domain-containing protein [Bacteroidales bacterium]